MRCPPTLVQLFARLAMVLWLGALAPAVAWAQADVVSTKRNTELRDGPSESAKVLIGLPAQTSLTRQTERSGPWVQVRTGTGMLGWVHMFDLGSASGPAPAGNGIASGFLRGVTNLFSKGNSQGQGATAPTATVGIRGLDTHDLSNAQPDVNAVTQMETYRVDAGAAQLFASKSGVFSRTVPGLTAPAATQASSKEAP